MASEISLQKALQQFLQKSRLKEGVRSLQIEDAWEDIMGKTIARYTDKIQVVQHTLFIHTSVAPLRNELVFQKNAIRDRVNEALGEQLIREVVVQ
jgi:hypothetical protein